MNQKKMNLQRKANIHSDVYESCSECGRDMFRTKDIWVDEDTDKYICKHCKDRYGINAVMAVDLD